MGWWKNSLADVGLTVLDGQSSTSEDGFTYGIILGYQILPYLAVEAAYVDLGDAEYKSNLLVTDSVATTELNSKLTAESSGATLSALGILPFASGWEVYGRVGVYFGSNDAELQLSSVGVTESASDSSNSQDLVWGGGVGFTRGDWTLRLDYQQFADIGDSKTGDVTWTAS